MDVPLLGLLRGLPALARGLIWIDPDVTETPTPPPPPRDDPRLEEMDPPPLEETDPPPPEGADEARADGGTTGV